MTLRPPFPPHAGDPMEAAEAAVLAALGGDGSALPALGRMLGGAGDAGGLAALIATFGLSESEAALLALLAVAGLRPEGAAHLAKAGADAHGLPLWLAMRLVAGAGPATPCGALAAFALVTDDGGAGLARRLRLPEAVLRRLAGAEARDPIVAARVTPEPAGPEHGKVPLAGVLARLLAARGADGLPPVLLVPPGSAPELAAAFAAHGVTAARLRAEDLPPEPEGRGAFARAWSRDAALDSLALLVEPRGEAPGLAAFLERLVGHVALLAPAAPTGLIRVVARLPAAEPPPAAAWRMALGPARAARLGPALARVAAQIRLPAPEIAALAARLGPQIDRAAPEAAARLLWHEAARALPDPGLPGVTLIEPGAGWETLVLPARTEAALRRVAAHVRHAPQVFDDWGFATGNAGRGVAALFAGPSGTGKTLAAEVLAHALDLRMMVIDLGQILSKYIGETSKNIAAAFAFAERAGTVMVWNEGDAVWGARGTVGHATDRHVNAEVGDLLQRIEGFGGMTVVTTNLRHAIDPAFLRRFRFILDFPLPGAAERLRLWRGAFPAAAPIALPAEIWPALAAVDLSGGAIRNIALAAAFRAAEAGRPVTPGDIAAELAEELAKLGAPMPHMAWAEAEA